MPKHIGIAAVSPEGSALCYRQIYRHATRILGDSARPRVTLHNEPFEEYVAAALRSDWQRVADLLRRSADILAKAGAEFCITPDNLMQNAVHLAEVACPIPWLTMTSAVADAVVRDNRRVVGLIGTKLVMFGSTYQSWLGIRGVRLLVPDEGEAEAVDSIIFRELVHGVVKEASAQRMIDVINHLASRGCEGVILGCTEAPLLVSADNAPMPVYDSTSLLAEAAVRFAIAA